ncbi:MAG: hypothetical protein Q4D31_02220 [Eubacteriales bacterium]|nr:hypothetical protein [Eubacteriales bacterium]
MTGWVIAAVVVIALSAGLIVWQAKALAKCRFWCRACGTLFELPWRRLVFRQHVNEEWWLCCPHCGRKGWCVARRKGKDGDA